MSKTATKLTLTQACLPTPEWSTDGTGFNRDARVIVKPLWDHGSLGLDGTSVTRGADAPRLVAERTLRFKTEHFAETFIERREFHVALLERISGVEVLPIPEVLFEGLEPSAPEIYVYDAKWTPDSAPYLGKLRRFGLEQREPELADVLKRLALSAWALFGFSGYARLDFRVDQAGAPFIIDVNPNPYLTSDTEYVAAAAQAGLSYQDLIASIVESSLASQASGRSALPRRIAQSRRHSSNQA